MNAQSKLEIKMYFFPFKLLDTISFSLNGKLAERLSLSDTRKMFKYTKVHSTTTTTTAQQQYIPTKEIEEIA
jgi:hypothetical protein